MIVSVSAGNQDATAANFRVGFFILGLARQLDIARIMGSAKTE
jgi:hypothetical protein